jgi:hypothetical protein
MKRFYTAVRADHQSGPARSVFGRTPTVLFTTRLRVGTRQPHIPGASEVWRNLFINHPQALLVS